MACQTSGIDFCVIGHQESWSAIERFINGVRTGQEKLSLEKITDIFSFLPPRVLFNVQVTSPMGHKVAGSYIETFIDPDMLDSAHARKNFGKVLKAAACAKKLGARITSLGGFTSILLEGEPRAHNINGQGYTTGNSLTAAFIVTGVETAARMCNINISRSKLLIIGATGDIGMGCVDYFKHRAGRLLLCARNQVRLSKLASDLSEEGVQVYKDTSAEILSAEADIIICVASSWGIQLKELKKNVLICDAGYPKNLHLCVTTAEVQLFHGGMGQVTGGVAFEPAHASHVYTYPAPGIAHGCILESIVLAFENRCDAFSMGRGNITEEKINEIYAAAMRHGIILAPFYNHDGLWPVNLTT